MWLLNESWHNDMAAVHCKHVVTVCLLHVNGMQARSVNTLKAAAASSGSMFSQAAVSQEPAVKRQGMLVQHAILAEVLPAGLHTNMSQASTQCSTLQGLTCVLNHADQTYSPVVKVTSQLLAG